MSRAGEVWELPLSSDEGDLYLIVGERTVMVQPKMSEYRPEKRVPCVVYDVVQLNTGKQAVWYARRASLEEESGYGARRVA